MFHLNPIARRLAIVLAGCGAFTVAATAVAMDVRDWGRKFDTASERFVVLASFGNQAVLDKETQLVWQRTAGAATSWNYAVRACTASVVGERMGWRLPSISELTSLLDGRMLPAGHPFLNVSQGYFWSSSDHPNGANYAHLKELLSYGIAFSGKANSYPHICVRGVGVKDR